MKKEISSNPLNIVVIVAALGYFVDIYDLILFGIVRTPSLTAIGVPLDQMTEVGAKLMNAQMLGMLLGGIVWGFLGDKRGRMSTLFMTILLYSLANIANGFVTSVEQYQWLRLIAGFGLAGELGIGITLVSEVLSKEHRAWGTGVVTGVGIAGAVLAFLVAEWGWREAYWVGGVLGLLLLFLRVYVHESGMFDKLKHSTSKRGNFIVVLKSPQKLLRYIASIFVGLPVWFVVGILIIPSEEFAQALGVTGDVSGGKAVMLHYMGAAFGSLITAYISQKLKSRKKALLISIAAMAMLCVWFFNANGISPFTYYTISFLLGVTMGYWAIFVTVASEQFGTNIRSTVTTTVPNFVRGGLVLMSIWWLAMKPEYGILTSAMIVGAVVFAIAIVSIFFLEESHGKDLDYLEE
ncbi:MAG: MFS transporter [Crocinitomicaceae bacterium]|nr:MFS transporter [Crocinitomicaceae bacterium]